MKKQLTTSQAAPLPVSRRKFILTGTAAATTFSIVPRHVLGGPGFVPPSEKITMAVIGCGTQALRTLSQQLDLPDVQLIAACDPVKDGNNYVDWSRDGLRSALAKLMGRPEWRRDQPGIPGGREVAKEVIETVYARQRGQEKFRGCATYADFRELLAREKDLNAVWIMTPDHLHATVAIAAMRKGLHVMMHKPLANRLQEARLVIETARETKVATHFLAASAGEEVRRVAGWIAQGAIGTLREVHNWSNRPVWPQYATIPTDRPPAPKDFDWGLWLGPSLDRPYHPQYTHATFRGWYEFGGGAVADMGHYSLWPVFQAFDLDAPYAVESTPSHVCAVTDQVCTKIRNDYAFPFASTIRFKFAAKGARAALDLFWYDGGMKPPTPEEVDVDRQELAAEGMMFVGDQGKILAGFRCENPRLIPERQSQAFSASQGTASPTALAPASAQEGRHGSWVKAFKGGGPTHGDFLLAGPISEAFNLGAVSLRLGGKRLLWDAASMKITNQPGANKHLVREFRPGWKLPA